MAFPELIMRPGRPAATPSPRLRISPGPPTLTRGETGFLMEIRSRQILSRLINLILLPAAPLPISSSKMCLEFPETILRLAERADRADRAAPQMVLHRLPLHLKIREALQRMEGRYLLSSPEERPQDILASHRRLPGPRLLARRNRGRSRCRTAAEGKCGIGTFIGKVVTAPYETDSR